MEKKVNILMNTGPYHHIIFYAFLFIIFSLIFRKAYTILFFLLLFYAFIGEVVEYLIVIFIDEIIFMFPHLSENKILNLFHFNFEWLDMFWNVIGGAIGIFIVFIFMRLLGKEKYEETIYISGPDK